MKDLVEVIAKSLVDHPDEVIVTQTEKENATIVELRVAPTDMGKVIGKQGRIAKAIRSVVKAAASKDDKKVIVADSRSPRDGRFIDEIGTYDPNTDPSTFNIDEEAAKKWLANGAQPTEVVGKIFKLAGITK